MDEKAVRATEALDFTAAEAVENGLADSIAPLDDAVAAFSANRPMRTTKKETTK